MDTPWVTSAALKPLLTMTQRMRCDPHGPSHRTLTNRGFGDQGREPRSLGRGLQWMYACKPRSLGRLEAQNVGSTNAHTAARSCWARKPVACPTRTGCSRKGRRLLPSFPLDQLKASRSEKENRALVVEAATEQWDWW